MKARLTRWIHLSAAGAALACAPTAAHAHLVETRLGDFYSGALHPLTDLQQVLPWIALAVLAAFQGAQRARWVILAFPLALLAGGLLSLVLPQPAFGPALGLALVAATGLAVAAALRVPLPVLLGTAGIMGLLHGDQNGAAMAASTDRVLFLAGVMASGYVVMTLATGAALAFLRGGGRGDDVPSTGSWRPIALRAGGSWVAAVGIMVLGLHLVTPGAS
ncbi:HupE/UreJ family protein [Xanthobacter dioxanivorans]|uniref:HupE/UreJ family protein n=1 Tax=Xanthobacter dioxanivorans TaxID=2528964 RepID=A0A974PQW8_9HYPH|nr:HupE/UreJ family protein [Xanthobacter dioxanivorans]QRG08057.1 HupE/UreJ family protein [Xanthobacter dioxanivorans]